MATAEVVRSICYSPVRAGDKRRRVNAEEITAVEKITDPKHEKEGYTAIRLKDGGVRYTREGLEDIRGAIWEALQAESGASGLVDAPEANERAAAIWKFEETLKKEIRNDPHVHAAWAALRQGADYHDTVLALIQGLVRRNV